MNVLPAKIESIEYKDQLSLVSLSVGKDQLKSIILESADSADYLSIGNSIHILFKETEVVISTSLLPSISLQNKIPCLIKAINKGQLLTRVALEHPSGNIHSIITTHAAQQLKLAIGQKVLAMIKTNEIMLSK